MRNSLFFVYYLLLKRRYATVDVFFADNIHVAIKIDNMVVYIDLDYSYTKNATITFSTCGNIRFINMGDNYRYVSII